MLSVITRYYRVERAFGGGYVVTIHITFVKLGKNDGSVKESESGWYTFDTSDASRRTNRRGFALRR